MHFPPRGENAVSAASVFVSENAHQKCAREETRLRSPRRRLHEPTKQMRQGRQCRRKKKRKIASQKRTSWASAHPRPRRRPSLQGEEAPDLHDHATSTAAHAGHARQVPEFRPWSPPYLPSMHSVRSPIQLRAAFRKFLLSRKIPYPLLLPPLRL